MGDEQKPTFKRPSDREAQPLNDQAAYFAYWEAQRIEKERQERADEDSLSIYERSRRRHSGW